MTGACKLAAAVAFLGLISQRVDAADISTTSPLLFRFAADPHVLVFGAGNDGANAFESTTSTTPANLSYGQDIYPGAQRVHLWTPTYKISPFDADAEDQAAGGYWPRMRAYIAPVVFRGIAIDCRVTTELIGMLEQKPDGFDAFARAFRKNIEPAAKPLLSVDAPPSDADRVRGAFEARWPELLVGLVVRQEKDLDAAARYDFVVAYPESVPAKWQGQPAVGYLHSRVGQKPVIMAMARPHFYEELFMLAAGAAGVQHDDLPAVGTAENTTAWKHLRALTGFTTNMSRTIRIAPELSSSQLVAGFRGYGLSFYLMPRQGAKVTYPVPATGIAPEYTGGWYNPVTDQVITLPRALHPSDNKLVLKAPTHEPWIYWHVPQPAATDQDSTTVLILSEPPEPDYPEDEETTDGL